MPLERNNVVNSFKADAETMLENDRNKELNNADSSTERTSRHEIEEIAEQSYLDGP